jgi:hypothetical protein
LYFEAVCHCLRANFAVLFNTGGAAALKKIRVMKLKVLMAIIAITLVSASCGLTSSTTIKPYDSFVLGNNEHGSFKVKMQNNSKNNVEVYQAPIGGGTHSPQTVRPNQRVTVKVSSNTALVIKNPSADTANVGLKVTGDLGLSMGYKQ